MSSRRLSTVDASFLEVESPSAHMHVGWSAAFSPPAEGPVPSFHELRDHIGARLTHAPRYRQRVASVPLNLADPVWVDDPEFTLDEHVVRSPARRLEDVVDDAMSLPLDRDRPLWKMWIADRLDDGRIGLVGKAHHCMVDGIAALELAGLLLTTSPERPDPDPEPWEASASPSALELFAGGVRQRLLRQLELGRLQLELLRSPRAALGLARSAVGAGRALVSFGRQAPRSALNRPLSPLRHLASCQRSLGELRQVKSCFETSLNDVVLAVTSGAVRRHQERRGEQPSPLKAMVPVNVREGADAAELGNRISFMWVDLPCDEADPVARLRAVNATTSRRKREGEPQGTGAALRVLDYMPRAVSQAVSHLFASPLTSNIVVSNIPGPPIPVYLLGCELEELYPVVPLTDSHTVSVAVFTVNDRACFSVYADRAALPDADLLARDLAEEVEELLAATGPGRGVEESGQSRTSATAAANSAAR